MEVYEGIVEKECLKRLLDGIGRTDRIVVDGNVEWGKEICWVIKEEVDKNGKRRKEAAVEVVGIGNDDEEDDEERGERKKE